MIGRALDPVIIFLNMAYPRMEHNRQQAAAINRKWPYGLSHRTQTAVHGPLEDNALRSVKTQPVSVVIVYFLLL